MALPDRQPRFNPAGALFPTGRNARLSDIASGLLLAYRGDRITGGAAPAAVNRDLCALGAFWTWCDEERGIAIIRATLPKEREPSGRERWLSSDEVVALRSAPRSRGVGHFCPPNSPRAAHREGRAGSILA